MLQSRETLENSLMAQIAVGSLQSIEDGIRLNNHDALEYAAQSLSDNLRSSVAEKANLPQHIIDHLAEDRNSHIRKVIIKQYFESLQPEVQDAFLSDVIKEYSSLSPERHTLHSNFLYGTSGAYLKEMLTVILRRLYYDGNDTLATRLITTMNGYEEGGLEEIKPPSLLRKLPNACRATYLPTRSINIIGLFHPDDDIRLDNIKKVLSLKPTDLRTYFPIQREQASTAAGGTKRTHRYRSTTTYTAKGDIKGVVYALFIDDPSTKIRMQVVDRLKHLDTLVKMAEIEYDPIIRAKALAKISQLEGRKQYAESYHKRRGSNHGKVF